MCCDHYSAIKGILPWMLLKENSFYCNSHLGNYVWICFLNGGGFFLALKSLCKKYLFFFKFVYFFFISVSEKKCIPFVGVKPCGGVMPQRLGDCPCQDPQDKPFPLVPWRRRSPLLPPFLSVPRSSETVLPFVYFTYCPSAKQFLQDPEIFTVPSTPNHSVILW